MRPPYRLVQDTISRDTVEALETLLEEARRGELIGVFFGGMYKRRTYIVNTTGEVRRNPTFARGMLASLDDRLSESVTGRM